MVEQKKQKNRWKIELIDTILKITINKTEPMDENEHGHGPYWKRLHHSWIFWVFLFLMFFGIMYYVVTVDFLFVPHTEKNMQKMHKTP